MAREIITKVWCDPCMDNDVHTEGVEIPPTVLGNWKPRVLALCEAHRKEYYDPFEDLLRNLGQIYQPEVQVRGAAVPDDEREPCPICGKMLKRGTSLSGHVRGQHEMTLKEANRKIEAGELTPAADLQLTMDDGDEGLAEAAPEGPAPKITRAECEVCGEVYEWPANGRPAQALGLHKRFKHGVEGKWKTSKKS